MVRRNNIGAGGSFWSSRSKVVKQFYYFLKVQPIKSLTFYRLDSKFLQLCENNQVVANSL